MHPLFTFPAAYVIDSKGIKAGIIVGSTLGIIGISLRLFVNVWGFWAIVVGQVIAGIGRPFILNCQAKISATWFRAEDRV
jgi:FLVCR family feline leukemia virus subgroup C receptor-related protein